MDLSCSDQPVRELISWPAYLLLGGPPHAVIVTIRDSELISGLSYVPIVPLLQGGGFHLTNEYSSRV